MLARNGLNLFRSTLQHLKIYEGLLEVLIWILEH